MITLPDFSKAFEYENNFQLSCDNGRYGKMIAHYELYKIAKDVPGDFVECGVFKGASFVRFGAYRELFGNPNQKLIGFDVFDRFPDTAFEADKAARQKFVDAAGEQSISVDQLETVLKQKKLGNYELIEGDITKTVPEYAKKHPDLQISILNLDTDIYEPAVTILEHLWPRISTGGVLILDDYNVFPGETKAVDEYFKGQNIKIQKYPYAKTPCYIVKN